MDELRLVNASSIEVKGKFLFIAALNLLHLCIVSKRQVVDGMCEIQLPTIHVDALNYLSKCMRREMEITWDLIDDYSSLH